MNIIGEHNQMSSSSSNVLMHPAGSDLPIFKYSLLGTPSDLPPKTWLVNGLMGSGEVVALYGEPGTGKSALAADLSFAVATGRKWFGRKVEKGAVLYFALERMQVIERRFAALQLSAGSERIPVALSKAAIDLTTPSEADTLVRTAKSFEAEVSHRLGLIVIDTLSRAIAGQDENAAGAMSLVAANLTRIGGATGAAILVLHHSTKSSGDLRGSSALLGAVDCAIRLQRRNREKDFIASVEKSNDTGQGERINFTLVEFSLGVFDRDTGKPDTTVIVAPLAGAAHQRQLSRRAESILNCILKSTQNGGAPREQILAEARKQGLVSDKRGSSAEQVRVALHELQSRGVISYDHTQIRLASPTTDPPP